MRALKPRVKAALDALGLLDYARAILLRVSRARKQQYYKRLLEQYRSADARLSESYDAFYKREIDASEANAVARFEMDRKSVLACALNLFSAEKPRDARDPSTSKDCANRILAALETLAGMERTGDLQAVRGKISARATSDDDQLLVIRAILDQVIDVELAPRFYDYDYIDDIVGIVGGRYCADRGPHTAQSAKILNALCILAGKTEVADWNVLSQALRKVLGSTPGYMPKRGNVTKHVRDVVPDMAEEFIALKAESNPGRFLEINREYSRRQAARQGLWDNRDLSLLRGYERNHHLLLRKLLELIQYGELEKDDEVLLVGPRHVDEVAFFRQHLGFRKTIGLDLFPFGKNEILAGDMHDMPFESNRFKLVYCAGTLSYSYNVRRVISEIARVSKRPAFVFLIDAAGRKHGPDALGRSDVVCVETLIGMFYQHPFAVLAKDAGRSLAPEIYDNEPCLAIRLEPEAR